MKHYNVFVIGTGVAGGKIASSLAHFGMKVGIADRREYGGTCALRGCNPKKVYVNVSQIKHLYDSMKGKGLEGTVDINWVAMEDFKANFTKNVTVMKEKRFNELGIDLYYGDAYFTDYDRIRINDHDIQADYIIVATGAMPRHMHIEGAEYIKTSEDFLAMKNMPDSVIFAGGGYISFEFAQITAAAGIDTAILHRSERPLKQFEPVLVDKLSDELLRNGVKILLNTPVERIAEANGQYTVYSGEKTYSAGAVFHGAGRVPQIDKLRIENAGIETNKGTIMLNDKLQTSNKRVFLAGDCNRLSPALKSVAAYEADIVTSNIMGKEKTVDYTGFTSVLFTTPPLSSAGLTEKQLKAKGMEYTVKEGDLSQSASSKRYGIKTGYARIFENNEGHILGAHILSHNSEEIINILSVAIKYKISADELKDTIFTFPTFANDLQDIL